IKASGSELSKKPTAPCATLAILPNAGCGALLEALRELRAKEKDLGRVIDPDEEQNERGSRPISGGLSLATEIPRECQAADGKQDRGEYPSSAGCAPGYRDRRHEFKNRGEDQSR